MGGIQGCEGVVDGAVAVVAGAGEVGAHGAQPAQGVPVAGDFAVPVTVAIGGLAPGDGLVVASSEVAQQCWVECLGLGGLRGRHSRVGLAQHVAGLTCPGLLIGMQVENALQVAEKVRYALLDPGGPFVELVPAHVVNRPGFGRDSLFHSLATDHDSPAATHETTQHRQTSSPPGDPHRSQPDEPTGVTTRPTPQPYSATDTIASHCEP